MIEPIEERLRVDFDKNCDYSIWLAGIEDISVVEQELYYVIVRHEYEVSFDEKEKCKKVFVKTFRISKNMYNIEEAEKIKRFLEENILTRAPILDE